MKLTENDIFNKYGYSGTGFGVHSPFTLSIGKWVKNAAFFGVGNSSSRHFVKNKKNLSSWRRTKDGLDDTRINYLSIFKSKKKNRLSIHHMLEALFLC